MGTGLALLTGAFAGGAGLAAAGGFNGGGLLDPPGTKQRLSKSAQLI